MSNVDKHYTDIVAEVCEQLDEDEELFNDRREYTVEDLARAYSVPEEEAVLIFNWIQSRVNPRYSVYGNGADFTKGSEELGNMIKESLHQGLDGWSAYQKVVIEAYLADIGLAISNSKE